VNDREIKRKLNFVALLYRVVLKLNGVFLVKDSVLIHSYIGCTPWCLCKINGPYSGESMISLWR